MVRAARRQGADTSLLHVVSEATVVPEGPPGLWLLHLTPSGTAGLGALDQGVYLPYGLYEDSFSAVRALWTVLSPIFSLPLSPVHLAALYVHASSMREYLSALPMSRLSPSLLPLGTALFFLGPSTTQSLHLLDTPSLDALSPLRLPPEPHLPRSRTGCLLVRPLPESVRLAPPSAPAPLLLLGRPVRWFLEEGFFSPFQP